MNPRNPFCRPGSLPFLPVGIHSRRMRHQWKPNLPFLCTGMGFVYAEMGFVRICVSKTYGQEESEFGHGQVRKVDGVKLKMHSIQCSQRST